MLILPLLVFLSVSLALVGLYLWFKPSPAQLRAQALASPQSVGDWQQTAVK